MLQTRKNKSMDTAWSHRTFLHPNFCGDLHCTVLYMLIMSFTHSTTLMISWGDVNFTDFTNYEHVFGKSGFFRSLMNSVIVVGCSCFFNCVIASMAAYGFEKKHFWGKEFLFKVYMLTLMIPGQVTMIPVFIIMKKLGLLNTYFALVVIILNAFGVF